MFRDGFPSQTQDNENEIDYSRAASHDFTQPFIVVLLLLLIAHGIVTRHQPTALPAPKDDG